MTQLQSNSLSVSAESVRELVEASDLLAVQSIEKAIEAGHLLIAAKAECRHGEWLPFLKRAGVGERKAQRLMKLSASGLNPSAVTGFGGIRGALEFLAMRDKAVDTMRSSAVEGAIDLRRLRSAIRQVDEIVMRFGDDAAKQVIREVDPKDAFLDAIEGRGLPKPGKHLEITAKAGDRITAIGVCWPSVDHAGFYYCATMQHPSAPDEDATAPVTWTKRPVRGEPMALEGVLHEPVWDFFATHMGAPASLWEFDDNGMLPEILADRLDLPFLVAESEAAKPWRDADSAATADLLESAGIVPPYPAAA